MEIGFAVGIYGPDEQKAPRFPRRSRARRASFRRVAARILGASLCVAGTESAVLAAPAVTEVAGVVQVQGTAYNGWKVLGHVPEELQLGDRLRTGTRARAVVTFDDGSRVEIGPEAAFSLVEAGLAGTSMEMTFGVLKAFVDKLSGHFQVRTPAAVCSVRGTQFQVQVLSGGRTTVDVTRGVVAVADNRGNEVLLRPNERIQVDFRGMGVPLRTPSRTELRRVESHVNAKREIGLEMTKEEVQSAAARELRLAEYQQGKDLVDVNGDRVRLEEYVFRPRPNQFKLVVLDGRADRFDYFYYLGTFNQPLPTDLGGALRQLPGCAGAPCAYYLTDFQTGRSNTADTIYEHGLNTMNGQVNLNGNGVPGDQVAFLFDANRDQFVNVANQPVFETLFNKYGFYIDGRLKYGWSSNALNSYSNATPSTTADPLTGARLTSANAWLDPATGQLATRTVNVTFPASDRMQERVYESYSDGSYLQWDNFIFSNGGTVASVTDFDGITSGAAFRQKLLDFNYEQVVTSNIFGGRKIDLVVAPKVLIETGLAQ